MLGEEFETWKMEWLKLTKEGKLEEAEKIYWEKMFPTIQENFLNQIQQQIKNGEIPVYDLLIIPMGLESSYYILLIKGLKPKQIYFLCTEQGERRFLDKIIKETGLTQDQYKKDVLKYADLDVVDVYEKIKTRIKMFEGKKIAVDLTRGSRTMIAGAAIVGDFFGCDLVHIDKGWYDDIKRGEPGTEKFVKVKNPLHIFGDLEQIYAIELFNRYQYIASNLFFKDIIRKVPDPREFEIKSLLSECYMFWDSFNYTAALPILEKVINKINQYHIAILDVERLKKNYDVLKHLNNVQYCNKKFIEILKDEDTVIHLIIDIFCNGERRSEQKKYEDAVSRLYRIIELISQHRLAKIGIDTRSPDYSKIDVERVKKCMKHVYGVRKILPQEISLMDGHIILFAINDDIWKDKKMKELKEFRAAIKLRDYSFIAHGIQFVSKDVYEKLKGFTQDLLKTLCKIYGKDFDSLIKNHEFLKL